MSRQKKHIAGTVKISLITSPEQDKILRAAAEHAGMGKDRSAWILAHAMRAAANGVGGELLNSPVMISGDLAERIRKEAERQAITPDAVVQQWAALFAAPSSPA